MGKKRTDISSLSTLHKYYHLYISCILLGNFDIWYFTVHLPITTLSPFLEIYSRYLSIQINMHLSCWQLKYILRLIYILRKKIKETIYCSYPQYDLMVIKSWVPGLTIRSQYNSLILKVELTFDLLLFICSFLF